MNLKPFQALCPRMEFITSPDHFFGTVREQYADYKKSGFFSRTSSDGLFIYQIEKEDRTFTGLVGCLDIQDFIDGKIKKHENTLASKEQQQMHLILKRGAQVKPVMLTYNKVTEIEKFIAIFIEKEKPILEIPFEANGEMHRFWAVTNGKSIKKIQTVFKEKIPHTYIADGHHRTSTTALMYERAKESGEENKYNQLLCALFPTTELQILDFNRIFEGFEDVSRTSFLVKLSRVFEMDVLQRPRKPKKKHEIIMFLDKEWFSLRWRKRVLRTYSNAPVVLDASLLNDRVLKDILGVQDIKTDSRIKYVEGPAGLEGVRLKALKNENRVGFILYPVDMKDFLTIADAGDTLPPKSTWFEPRIKNGMMVKEF